MRWRKRTNHRTSWICVWWGLSSRPRFRKDPFSKLCFKWKRKAGISTSHFEKFCFRDGLGLIVEISCVGQTIYPGWWLANAPGTCSWTSPGSIHYFLVNLSTALRHYCLHSVITNLSSRHKELSGVGARFTFNCLHYDWRKQYPKTSDLDFLFTSQ